MLRGCFTSREVNEGARRPSALAAALVLLDPASILTPLGALLRRLVRALANLVIARFLFGG
jgi:hypothetical protein